MAKKQLFKIRFQQQNQLVEIYAQQVGSSNLLGFIEIQDIVFGEKSTVLVDPTEEKLKAEFAGVRRTYLPIASVIRIDEVSKAGTSKILPFKSEPGTITSTDT